MSEFKFACPVCGQHITADSRSSGSQLDCPTCFQRIVVPQAPASGNSNLILSATLVGKPRPVQREFSPSEGPAPERRSFISFLFWGLLVLGVAGAAYIFRDRIFEIVRGYSSGEKAQQKHSGHSYPIPTNFAWTLNLNNMAFPEVTASGGIRGQGFMCEQATLQGGNLTLRQGKSRQPDLGITVQLFAKEGEELSKKTVLIGPERPPPIPTVVLRWKDENDQGRKQDFTSGYALKMSFGEANNSRMPGKIFVAFPDEAKSFVAGTFEAEIRKAPPPKPKPQ